MEEQLISFKTAKLAKELGFNLEVIHFFNIKEDLVEEGLFRALELIKK